MAPLSRRGPRRFAFTLLDSLVTAPVRPRQPSPGDYLRMVFNPDIRHFDRPAAALSFLDALVPGAARWCARLVIRPARLPFHSASLGPMAHGSGTTVYQFESPQGTLVCKAHRQSLGLSAGDLARFAVDRQRRYRGTLRQYASASDVFPPARFVVAHGPLMSVPVVMTVQPFVPGPARDLLQDVDDEELEELALSDRPGSQIRRFFACTIDAWETGDWIVDLGRDNLVLAGEAGAERLTYLDVEMLPVAELKASRRAPYYASVIQRMKRSLDRVSDTSEPSPAPATQASLG